MDLEIVADLLDEQHGVISRRQVLSRGGDRHDIARALRRREWVRVLPGVYLDHTGEPTWLQQGWAGVLHCWPAALSHGSALRAAAGPGWRRHDDSQPIEIAVASWRNRVQVPGYRIRRLHDFDVRVLWNLGPPRVRLEEAAIDVAAEQPNEFAAISVLADVCQSRRTTAARMLEALDRRQRLRRSKWLAAVLADIAAGTCSVLEHGYLVRVERAHGLPSPRRQRLGTSGRGSLFRDVEYRRYGMIVELDGRLFHNSAGQRDRDLDRDLDASIAGRSTIRLGWGQVYDRPCRTAQRLGTLLGLQGWTGSARSCGPDCLC